MKQVIKKFFRDFDFSLTLKRSKLFIRNCLFLQSCFRLGTGQFRFKIFLIINNFFGLFRFQKNTFGFIHKNPTFFTTDFNPKYAFLPSSQFWKQFSKMNFDFAIFGIFEISKSFLWQTPILMILYKSCSDFLLLTLKLGSTRFMECKNFANVQFSRFSAKR